MLLSNRTIVSRMLDAQDWEAWQRIGISPLADGAVQPCSVDVHLGTSLKVYEGPLIDTRRDNSPWWHDLVPIDSCAAPEDRAWVLQPDKFYLGVLLEHLIIPEDCCGQLGGVSSLARDGFLPHQQAGLLDPGWHGWATLEISVQCEHTVVYAGDRAGQVTYTLLDQRAMPAYRGRYQGDAQPQPARIFLPGRAA